MNDRPGCLDRYGDGGCDSDLCNVSNRCREVYPVSRLRSGTGRSGSGSGSGMNAGSLPTRSAE